MYKDKSILAIIPARGKSKRLPGKNIKNFLGKPLIAWSIERALESGYIDRVIVSTDSEKIASVARSFKADIPFMRPKRLATSFAKTVDVIFHALNWLEKNNKAKYDIVVLLQPTSPLRLKDDVDKALRLLLLKKAGAVVSVSPAGYYLEWVNKLPANLNMNNFVKKGFINKNRESLENYYRLNGCLYIAKTEYLKKMGSFFGPKTYAYKMEASRSVDIDTIIDFSLAEALARKSLR